MMTITDKQLSQIIIVSFFAGISIMGFGISFIVLDVMGVIITSVSLIFLVAGGILTLQDILKTHSNKKYRTTE